MGYSEIHCTFCCGPVGLGFGFPGVDFPCKTCDIQDSDCPACSWIDVQSMDWINSFQVLSHLGISKCTKYEDGYGLAGRIYDSEEVVKKITQFYEFEPRVAYVFHSPMKESDLALKNRERVSKSIQQIVTRYLEEQ